MENSEETKIEQQNEERETALTDESASTPIEQTASPQPEESEQSEAAHPAEEHTQGEDVAHPAESAPTIEEAAQGEENGEQAQVIAPKTRAEEKRLAAIYMIFAAAIVFCVYIVQFMHFLEPLFYRVYYGNLQTLFYYVCNIVVWIPMLVGIHLLLKKYTGFKAFHLTRKELPLKRSLLLYACAIVPIFIVSAALGFELKIVYELGKRVTGVQVWSNASMYLHGGVKLLFFIIFIEIVQEAGELLYKGKYDKFIPWGGIAAMLIFGFGDVIVAYATGANVLFAWLYVAFDLLYGVIYLIANKSYFVTYIVSFIIFIL